ncbi:MAG TPA: ABC transporter substrate-binding protein [Streptosporangiaceae bacterium]
MRSHAIHASTRARSVAILAVLPLFLMLAACGSHSSAGAGGAGGSGALTFAVFNPFSGPDASFGPEQLAGCIPAAAAISAAGGILGHKTVTCKTADSRGDPADAVPAAEQLISTTPSLVGVLGPSSDEASATVPLFNRAHIPMFADTGQAVFNHSSFTYFYRITPPDDAVGYAMAVYAHQKGYPTAAAVFGNDISSQGSLPTVVSGFKKLGGKIVLVQRIPLDQSSYRTEVSALIAAHPDVIFTEADPQTSATYFAEMRQFGHLGPFIGTDGTTQPPWLKAVGHAVGTPNLKRLYVGAQPYAPTTGVPYQLWLSEITAVKSQVSQPASQWYGDSYSLAAWDSINLMALAMEAAKSTDPSVFRPWIVKLTSPSPSAVVVHDFAQGKAALSHGKTIQYVGATSVISFDRWQNSPGAFEIVSSDGSTKVATYTAAQIAAAK